MLDSTKFIVLVCGGRNFADVRLLTAALDNLPSTPTLIVHGEARGADTLAGQWARKNKIPVKSYPAQWNKHGRAAGPIRNKEMLDKEKPDLVVAFPGGKGTAHMAKIARENGVDVRLY